MVAFLFLVGCLAAIAIIACGFLFVFTCFMGWLSTGGYQGIIFFAGCLILMIAAFITWGPSVLIWAERTYQSLLGG